MLVEVKGRYCGVKKAVSKKGTPYGDVLFFEVDRAGNQSIEQSKIRTFSPQVLGICDVLKVGEFFSATVEVKECVIVGVLGNETEVEI